MLPSTFALKNSNLIRNAMIMCKINEIDILKFDYWIKNRDYDDNWVTVAQWRKITSGNSEIRFGTTSALVSNYDVKVLSKTHDLGFSSRMHIGM